MEIKQLLQKSDVISLILKYSLNNNFINPECYRLHTKQSEGVVNELKKLNCFNSAASIDSDDYQNKRIISNRCPINKKQIIIPSRSIFCGHLDCVNFSDMISYVGLEKLIFL